MAKINVINAGIQAIRQIYRLLDKSNADNVLQAAMQRLEIMKRIPR